MTAGTAPARTGRLEESTQRFLNLTWTLAVTDWKLRFYGSVLGVAWTLLRPFAFFGWHLALVVKTALAGDFEEAIAEVDSLGVVVCIGEELEAISRAQHPGADDRDRQELVRAGARHGAG